MAEKLDLWKTLKSINVKNRDVYSSLSEDEAKQFVPLVLMRWMTGSNDARQIILLNEFANRYVFSLYKHKPLLANLLVACSSGDDQRYSWLKGSPKSTPSAPTVIDVIREYFEYNTREAVQAYPLLSNEDIMSYAEQLGRQPDEMSKIKKELKAR